MLNMQATQIIQLHNPSSTSLVSRPNFSHMPCGFGQKGLKPFTTKTRASLYMVVSKLDIIVSIILHYQLSTRGLHFHSPMARENTTPTRAITRDIAC